MFLPYVELARVTGAYFSAFLVLLKIITEIEDNDTLWQHLAIRTRKFKPAKLSWKEFAVFLEVQFGLDSINFSKIHLST